MATCSMMKPRKTVLIYSGGLDSTVLLYSLLMRGDEVTALSVDYGQRHRKELDCAKAICLLRNVKHLTADLRGITHLLGGSSQTDPTVPVPYGHYAEDNMKATVVPNRNMIMLAVAAATAISHKADWVAYAAHAGDHAIYPDCRPPFIKAMNSVLGLCDFQPIHLLTPFDNMTKKQIVELGILYSVPFEKTWSCYQGGEYPCGRCGTCQERVMAFHLANAVDPLDYGRPWVDVVLEAEAIEEAHKRG